MQKPTNSPYFYRQTRPQTHTHTRTHLLWGWVQTALSAVPHQVSILKGCKPIPDSLSLSQSRSLFPSQFHPSSQCGVAAMALGGHTEGSIIIHAEGNYQVVWRRLLSIKVPLAASFLGSTIGPGFAVSWIFPHNVCIHCVLYVQRLTFRGQCSSWWLLGVLEGAIDELCSGMWLFVDQQLMVAVLWKCSNRTK